MTTRLHHWTAIPFTIILIIKTTFIVPHLISFVGYTYYYFVSTNTAFSITTRNIARRPSDTISLHLNNAPVVAPEAVEYYSVVALHLKQLTSWNV